MEKFTIKRKFFHVFLDITKNTGHLNGIIFIPNPTQTNQKMIKVYKLENAVNIAKDLIKHPDVFEVTLHRAEEFLDFNRFTLKQQKECRAKFVVCMFLCESAHPATFRQSNAVVTNQKQLFAVERF